jgi:hypothetical protein
MDYICFKSTTVHALNQMRRMFPAVYTFFPLSFILPHQFADLHRAHICLQAKTGHPVTWIIKPRSGCCGEGIRLVQHIYSLTHQCGGCVVQRYVAPYLVDGFKFDFRFYILIASLAPYTVYLYREGLARFCTQKCCAPASGNLSAKFAHLTNTSINKENSAAADMSFTRLASDVLAHISEIDPKRGPALWSRICDVSLLSLLAIWSPIVSCINTLNSERHCFDRAGVASLDSFSKYFHILGIDIMISECCRPVVLELNDKPSMVVCYECEEALKRDMVYDAFAHLSLDGTPLDGPEPDNWQKLLPVAPGAGNAATVSEIITRTSGVFRTSAANRERPHYRQDKEKLSALKSRETFPDKQPGADSGPRVQ